MIENFFENLNSQKIHHLSVFFKSVNTKAFDREEPCGNINSHAVGMAVARPLGFEIDFVRNPISGSAAWFFVIILKFILTPIFEIKVHEKKFLDTKKISFSKPDFQYSIYL